MRNYFPLSGSLRFRGLFGCDCLSDEILSAIQPERYLSGETIVEMWIINPINRKFPRLRGFFGPITFITQWL